MDTQKQLIIINGIDKTGSVVSLQFHEGKCDVTFQNSPRVYSYNRDKVQVFPVLRIIKPEDVIFKGNGSVYPDIRAIMDFGEFYRIERKDGKELTFHKSEVEMVRNCLSDQRSSELFEYFKRTASAISLVSGNGDNILQLQYDRITSVSEETVLAKYLDFTAPVRRYNRTEQFIYPFGLNQSQKTAVENAFSSQVSIIQGPPGTGKTQTILNIIANAVCRGETVAVVSNNNSATFNVVEKLGKKKLAFLTAYLGSLQNKTSFLEKQTARYPDMSEWQLDSEAKRSLVDSVKQLSEELDAMLASRNRIAAVEQELLQMEPEQFYFKMYYSSMRYSDLNAERFSRLTSEKLLSLWVEYEDYSEHHTGIGFFRKLWIASRFGRAALSVFGKTPEEAIPFLQKIYYERKISELSAEKEKLEASLKNYHFQEKMEELGEKSMALFKAELARRYRWHSARPIFDKRDFRGKSDAFTQEYPVVLSTTYSIKGTLSTDFIYDYLIIDEASQVDLSAGVLAFSCARNIVIVGDQKQLPNVLTADDIKTADDIWNQYSFDERYHYATHSLLASAAEIWKDAPSVLLREHYRCHPKIAGFFNQKFYHGDLIIMTQDHGEEGVLSMYRTAAGNHARGHLNQRQIDVIREEVLPALQKCGFRDIGIITPYREQAAAIRQQLGNDYEAATVHKFQGREKDAIVLASVDNIIGSFVDDPNLMNVAVSRAVKALVIVVSDSKKNEKTNFGDLEKYIRYNNLQIIDSRIFSVFDMLYKGYAAQRMDYLKRRKRVSEFDSENLAYSVIEAVLKLPQFAEFGCVMHSSLATLVKDYSSLSERERSYASNPLTHVDFLVFNQMDKAPIMAIEVDGTRFHAEGSKQAERDEVKNAVLKKCGIPLLRLRTNESGEKERIIAMLDRIVNGYSELVNGKG